MGTVNTLIYPVKDLAQAKARFSKLLGAEPYADAPYYVGFRLGEIEVGLDPNGHQSTGPVGYFEVTDIKEAQQLLVDAGATIIQETKDVGGGMLIAVVKDVDGNAIGLRQTPS